MQAATKLLVCGGAGNTGVSSLFRGPKGPAGPLGAKVLPCSALGWGVRCVPASLYPSIPAIPVLLGMMENQEAAPATPPHTGLVLPILPLRHFRSSKMPQKQPREGQQVPGCSEGCPPWPRCQPRA